MPHKGLSPNSHFLLFMDRIGQKLIEAEKLFVKIGSHFVLKDINLMICQGEGWAIVGPSGSGKTLLGQVIKKRRYIASGSLQCHFSDTRIQLIEQQPAYGGNASQAYYQARFNSVSAEESPVVEAVLAQIYQKHKQHQGITTDQVLELLGIAYLRHTRLLELSNGENKKLQIAQALLQNPQVLILDNPFIGLDTAARQKLHQIINQLIASGMTLLLITSPTEIPEQITRVIEMEAGRIQHVYTRTCFVEKERKPASLPVSVLASRIPAAPPDKSFTIAVRLEQVKVQYGDRKILDQVSWQVRRGEHWALSGPNGAGKSTLLSLISGDHPQAYANTIYLFDQKRGSGESIWDIKRRIGFVSPELHLCFNRTLTCAETVASGLSDKMVPDKNLSAAQKERIYAWMDLFQILPLEKRRLADIPLSEQRLALLARALVKNPPMLILDEPCQGLDPEQTKRFTFLTDVICKQSEKTLIYVSHQPEDIPACVDKYIFLQEGKVKQIREESADV